MLDLTRLFGTMRNFVRPIRAEVADSGRSSEVSYRALSQEAMRLVVRQFLKWPAEMFPRGAPIHGHGETFPTCCPPRKLSARAGKLPVCPCTAIVFQKRSPSRSEASKQLSQLVASWVFDFNLRVRTGASVALARKTTRSSVAHPRLLILFFLSNTTIADSIDFSTFHRRFIDVVFSLLLV
jgi:hypothetical protein